MIVDTTPDTEAVSSGGESVPVDAEPLSVDDAPQAPGGQRAFDKALQARLARERAKSQRDIAAARDEAIATFRRENGLSDEVLGDITSNRYAGLHKELANLQSTVAELRGKEATRVAQRRDDLLRRELEPQVLAEAMDIVLQQLDGKFLLDDTETGLVTVDAAQGDPKRAIQEYLDAHAFLCKATGRSGAGSRVAPHPPTRPQERQAADSVFGAFTKPTEDERREAVKAYRRK